MDQVSVRPFDAGEWRIYRDLRTRALRDAPDAFGSTLEEAMARSDHEWASRLADATDVDLPLVAEIGGIAAGLAWGRLESARGRVAYVLQMWVAPEHRSHGAGSELLRTIVDWATARNARAVYLSVACGNAGATRLYTSAGFHPAGQPRPLRAGSEVLAQPMRLDLNR